MAVKTVETIYNRLKNNLVNAIIDASKREELKAKAIENLILYCEIGEGAGCYGLYFNSSTLSKWSQEELEDKCRIAPKFDDDDQHIWIQETIFGEPGFEINDLNDLYGEKYDIDLEDDPNDITLIVYVLSKVCAELEKEPNPNGLDNVALGKNWKILIDENGYFDFKLRKKAHQYYNSSVEEFIELMAQE